MLPVDIAISKFRRDLTIARAPPRALLTVAVISLLAQPLFGLHQDWMPVLILVGGVWLLLSYRSVQGSRIAADSPSLIAAGEFDCAESHIDTALNSFFPLPRLASFSAFTIWPSSATPKTAGANPLFFAGGSLPETGQHAGHGPHLPFDAGRFANPAWRPPRRFGAMNRLFHYRLSLGEALTLQLLQLDYGWRIGAWESMLQGVGTKVQMCELMPPMNAARSQALLAVAAYKLNRTDLANWLRRRAELLADPREISAGRPVLEEMFRQNT